MDRLRGSPPPILGKRDKKEKVSKNIVQNTPGRANTPGRHLIVVSCLWHIYLYFWSNNFKLDSNSQIEIF